MLLVNCKTSIAIVLFGIKDQKGIYRFPVDAPETPGLMFAPKPLQPINEQILDRIFVEIERTHLNNIKVWQEYSAELPLSDGRLATLYLACLEHSPELCNDSWQTLPDILRLMPKTRNRLAYLKAFQVMTGALSENVKVFEGEEANNLLN